MILQIVVGAACMLIGWLLGFAFFVWPADRRQESSASADYAAVAGAPVSPVQATDRAEVSVAAEAGSTP